MAPRMLRRGLPRVPGGEPWPPADVAVEVPDADGVAAGAVGGGAVGPGAVVAGAGGAVVAGVVAPEAVVPASAVATTPGADTPDVGRNRESVPRSGVSAPGTEQADAVGAASADAGAGSVGVGAASAGAVVGAAGTGTAPAGLRRGLPRVPGGEPWPPAGTAPAVEPGVAVAAAIPAGQPAGREGAAVGRADAGTDAVASDTAPRTSGADTPDVGRNRESVPRSGVSAPGTERAEAADGIPLRRGLPRTAGGDPWPPAGTVARARATAAAFDGAALDGAAFGEAALDEAALDEAALDEAALDEAAFEGTESPAVLAAEGAAPVAAVAPVVPAGGSGPLPFVRTVWDGRAPRRVPATPASDAAKRRPTWPQAVAGLFAAAGLGVLAAAAVAFVRTLLSLDPLQEFLAAFPGHYEPAINVEPGFAPWVGWQHFFNMFLMVLIIRSGLTIRREKRPTAFWTPRKNPKGKVSLTIWFHQALDVLWLVNGAVFVVLLFATGHWVRIVPTSWEVLPNALSAALQYVSLDWPTENGWNNYNSLQQLAYFVTVFLAAPLAAVTGFRMSGLWPKKAERLSKAYPIEWARKVHFPVMLYFVLFIIAHVALVFLTGMLANLNHMFASSDAAGWAGFWVFVAALAVIAAGWAAARPLVIAPIAKLFGTVSGR